MAQKNVDKQKKSTPIAHAVGRRKTAVARIWVRKGDASVNINGKDVSTYFNLASTRAEALKPFEIVPVAADYAIDINVNGGGYTAQAGAVQLAIARALVALDAGVHFTLRSHGLLTVDPRQVERKKYGLHKARRAHQFVKR